MAQDATGSSTPAGETVEMTDALRDEQASQLVDRFSLWAGAAGLVPFPIIDGAVAGGVQIQMLRKLSEIYGVPFSENMGKSVLATLAGAVVPTTSAIGVASMVKGLPVIGTLVGTVTTPVLFAGATYVIGKVFIQHFTSGGTLLDFNPPDYREFIKAQKEKLGGRFKSAPPAN